MIVYVRRKAWECRYREWACATRNRGLANRAIASRKGTRTEAWATGSPARTGWGSAADAGAGAALVASARPAAALAARATRVRLRGRGRDGVRWRRVMRTTLHGSGCRPLGATYVASVRPR